MKSCLKKRLDFREAGDKTELAAAKYPSKFKSSNAVDKHYFIDNDADTIDSNNNGDCTALVETLDEREDCAFKRMSMLDVRPQIGSNLTKKHLQFAPNKPGSRSCFSQMDGSSSPKVARLESSSSDEYDVVPDADVSMREGSLSTSSDFGEDESMYDGSPLSECFGNWGMDDRDLAVACFPDYIKYHHKHITDSMITFSGRGIGINGPIKYGGYEMFEFWWGIKEILEIESKWCDRAELAIIKICVIPKGVSIDDAHGLSGVEYFDLSKALVLFVCGHEQSLQRDLKTYCGTEELMFAISEKNWLCKQEAIINLDAYNHLWNIVGNSDEESDEEDPYQKHGVSSSKPYFPTFDKPFKDVIFPKGDPDAVSVGMSDVYLLQPNKFVNDTIIDFYIKHLKRKIGPREKNRFHFFNSFFFRKLTDPEQNELSAAEVRAAFQRVHKWTIKINLFEKDFIFIPVNFIKHWSLIVICYPGEVAEFQDVDVGRSFKVPCILHMDSIRGTHSGLEGLLKSYLLEEWKERHRKDNISENISSRFLNLRFVSLELPQQQNTVDCGLFLLHYAELFLEGVPVNFNPFKINNFSNFLTPKWFLPNEASLKRSYIQRLVDDLLDEEGSRKNSPDASGSNKKFTSKCPKSFGENKPTVKFIPRRCRSSIASHKNVESSQSRQGLELNLKSFRNFSDLGLVLKEVSDLGAAEKPCHKLFEQNSHFDEFNKVAVSPMEGDESSENIDYCPAAETRVEPLSETFNRDNSLKVVGINLSLEEETEGPSSPVPDNIAFDPCGIPDLNTENNPDDMLNDNGNGNREGKGNGNGNGDGDRNGEGHGSADPVTPLEKNLLGLYPQEFDHTKENGTGTGTGTCEGVQSICDDDSVWGQHTAKRRRVTPLEEEGGSPRSMVVDLHL